MPRRSPSAPPGIDPLDAHLGRALRQARRARGWSQQALADRLSLSGQQVQKYETGANRVSAAALHRMAQALGRPLSDFFPATADAPSTAAAPSRDARVLAALADGMAPPHRQALRVLAEGLVRRAAGRDRTTD